MAEKEKTAKDAPPAKRAPTMKSLLKGYKSTHQLRQKEAEEARGGKKVQSAGQS